MGEDELSVKYEQKILTSNPTDFSASTTSSWVAISGRPSPVEDNRDEKKLFWMLHCSP